MQRLRQIITMLAFLCLSTLGFSSLSTSAQGAGNCILVLGDSLVRGESVMQVPNVGFVTVQMTDSFASVLQSELNQTGQPWNVFDLSVERSSLNPATDITNYMATSEYQQMRTYACPYAVIFPFVNDIPSQAGNQQLYDQWWNNYARLIQDIQSVHTDIDIILVMVHEMQPTEFGLKTYENNAVLAPDIALLRDQYRVWCSPPAGAFTRLGNVRCLDPFAGIPNAAQTHLHQQIPHAMSSGFIPTSGGDTYAAWAGNPNLQLIGDGMHYNATGMSIVSQRVVYLMRLIRSQRLSQRN